MKMFFTSFNSQGNSYNDSGDKENTGVTMTMTMMMMISSRKSVVVGVGHKPTEVKSWQVPPLSSPPACHHLFVFLPIK